MSTVPPSEMIALLSSAPPFSVGMLAVLSAQKSYTCTTYWYSVPVGVTTGTCTTRVSMSAVE